MADITGMNSIPTTDRDELPVESFAWGTLQWVSNAALCPGAKQTVGFCSLLPRVRNALHFHPNCDEVLTVLSGCGRHSYDGEWVELRAGSTIVVPAGVRHHFENTGDEVLECVIVFSSGMRETVFLE